MPTVTVNPINTISVRVNQGTQSRVAGTSQFIGAANSAAEIAQAIALANTAITYANNALFLSQAAYDNSNTKLSLTGGTISGNLIVNGEFSTANNTIDAGLF